MASNSVLDKKKAHARKRFDERYCIKLTEELSRKLIQRIQTRDRATRLCTMSHRATVWSVFVESEYIKGAKDGIMVPMVYDKDRKILVTALPQACNEIANIHPDMD